MSLDKTRYNKFIPLFGNKYDNRVRLFLDEMCNNASIIAAKQTLNNYHANDVYFIYNENSNLYPTIMQNRFFINKIEGLGLTEIHPEWKYFIGAIAYHFDPYYELEPNTSGRVIKKGSTDPKDIDFLNSLHHLYNAKPKSSENVVCAILDKILAFNTPGDNTPKLFTDNNYELQNAETIFTAYPFRNIYEQLFGYAVQFEDDPEGTDIPITDFRIIRDIFRLTGNIPITGDLNSKKNQTVALLPDNLEYKSYLIEQIMGITNSNNWPEVITTVFKQALVTGPYNKSAFGYMINKFFITTILEEHTKQVEPLDLEVSKILTEEIAPSQQKYYRKLADGLLYTIVNNVEVGVHSKSEEFAKLTVENKCFGTGFINNLDGNIQYTCTDYLRDCLKGRNIQECKRYLKNPNFWTDAVKEVENMLPDIAIITLKAFKFKVQSQFDELLNRRLTKVQTTEKLLESLKDEINNGSIPVDQKLTLEDLNLISNNTKLISY